MDALFTTILEALGPSTTRILIKTAQEGYGQTTTKKEANKLLYAGNFKRVNDVNPPVWDVDPRASGAATYKEFAPGFAPAETAKLSGSTVIINLDQGISALKLLMVMSKLKVAGLVVADYGVTLPDDGERAPFLRELKELETELKESMGLGLDVTVLSEADADNPPRLAVASLRKQLATVADLYVVVGENVGWIAAHEITTCEALGVPVVYLKL
jgi:hypothetical protein